MSFSGDLNERVQRLRQKAQSELARESDAEALAGGGGNPQVQQYIDEIPDMYQQFFEMPNPAAISPVITGLSDTMRVLCVGQDTRDPVSARDDIVYPANKRMDELIAAGNVIQIWTGWAATRFKADFIDPFPSLVRNQFLLVAALKSAMEAEQALWQRSRENILEIASQTANKFDAMANSCGQNGWPVILTAAAAVAGIITEIPSLGASTAFVVAGVGGAATVGGSVAGAARPDEAPTVRIDGHDVVSVLDSMRACIAREVDVVNHAEDKIRRAMENLASAVRIQPDIFVSNRPALADATSRTVTGPEYLGYAN